MNLKQIQAVEFILFNINHNKRLVVEYKEQLLSADFLEYQKSDTRILTKLNKQGRSLEYSDNSNYFAHVAFYDNVFDTVFDGSVVKLGGNNYPIRVNQEITSTTLSDTVESVKKSYKINDKKKLLHANITPRNVHFFNTTVTLPFYLFPDDANFTPVSVVDRELKFD